MVLPRLTPAQTRSWVIKSVSAIGVVFWIGLIVMPQQRALADLSATVRTRRAQLAELHRGMAQRSAMEAESARLAQQYRVPGQIPPPEEQLPGLLKVITETAKTTQVGLLTVRPKTDFGTMAQKTGGYVEVPLEISASGGYHELGAFLDGLEQSPSLVFRVERLGIQPDPKDLWHHHATFMVRLYLVAPSAQRLSLEEAKPRALSARKPS